jgi:hypothetical protein
VTLGDRTSLWNQPDDEQHAGFYPQIGVEKLVQLRKLEEVITRDESSSVVLKKRTSQFTGSV